MENFGNKWMVLCSVCFLACGCNSESKTESSNGSSEVSKNEKSQVTRSTQKVVTVEQNETRSPKSSLFSTISVKKEIAEMEPTEPVLEGSKSLVSPGEESAKVVPPMSENQEQKPLPTSPANEENKIIPQQEENFSNENIDDDEDLSMDDEDSLEEEF